MSRHKIKPKRSGIAHMFRELRTKRASDHLAKKTKRTESEVAMLRKMLADRDDLIEALLDAIKPSYCEGYDSAGRTTQPEEVTPEALEAFKNSIAGGNVRSLRKALKRG